MAALSMHADPPPMTAEEQHLSVLLRETTACDANRIAAAEMQIANASDQPGFALALLACVSRAPKSSADSGAADDVSVPAAAALHNFVRARWPHRLVHGEREPIRAAILRSLLVAPTSGPVTRLLAETFRIVITADVTKQKCWPDLLPALCAAMRESDLMLGKEQSPVRTANALVAVHTLLKPYKYFQNPTLAKEAAPPELEAIVKALLEPLLGMLGVLASGTLAAAAAEAGGTATGGVAGGVAGDMTTAQNGVPTPPVKDEKKQAENDALLHTLLKCFHHTIAAIVQYTPNTGLTPFFHNRKAYMPHALVPSLRHWLEVLVKLLERSPSFFNATPGQTKTTTPRRKAAKRAIQCLISLVTRHRRHVDKALPTLCGHATHLAGVLSGQRLVSSLDDPPCPIASRTAAACFDLLARVAETAPGFKLLAPNFGRLLEQAIFPALRASAEDEHDWETDEEEYLRRNLPNDFGDDQLTVTSGFNEELYAPRQSACNLLALLADRGSGGGAGALDDSTSSGKDKRSRKNSKAGGKVKKNKNDTPGDVALVFLDRFPPPGDGNAPLDGTGASAYYGVLLAYGALSTWLAKHKNETSSTIVTLARRRVFPALSRNGAVSDVASAMLRANACWCVGELCVTDHVPATEAHVGLLDCLTCQTGVEHPALRSAAASAIASALHNSCWPTDWTPLLTAAAAAAAPVAGDADSDTDASRLRAIRLIAVAAETAPEHCGAPATATALAAALARACASATPSPPNTFPPIVETALEALNAVVEASTECVESYEEEGDDTSISVPHRSPNHNPPHQHLVALVPHCCDALRRAWLPSAWGLDAWPASSGDSGDGMADDADAGGKPVPCAMGDCSRLLTKALRWCPDLRSTHQINLAELVVAHAELLVEWDAFAEEEDESGLCAITAVAEAFTRGVLPSHAVSASLNAHAKFVAESIDGAPNAVACARACRASHAILGLASKVAPTSAATVSLIGEAATSRLRSLESCDLPLARPLALAVAACVARSAGTGRLDFAPDTIAEWARAASRALARDDGDFVQSELRVVAVAALRALAGGAANDSEARAGVVECALRAVIGLRDIDGAAGMDKADDDSGDSDDSHEDVSDDDDNEDDEDDDEDDENGNGTEDDEETEQQFLARYAAEAQRMAQTEVEDPDAGEVDDAEDGEEISTDGVQMGPPGSEATALLGWLSSAASASDLGALAATLQAQPIAGLERVGDLQSVLSSMAYDGANQRTSFPTPGAASPSNSQGGIDFGGLRL